MNTGTDALRFGKLFRDAWEREGGVELKAIGDLRFDRYRVRERPCAFVCGLPPMSWDDARREAERAVWAAQWATAQTIKSGAVMTTPQELGDCPEFLIEERETWLPVPWINALAVLAGEEAYTRVLSEAQAVVAEWIESVKGNRLLHVCTLRVDHPAPHYSLDDIRLTEADRDLRDLLRRRGID